MSLIMGLLVSGAITMTTLRTLLVQSKSNMLTMNQPYREKNVVMHTLDASSSQSLPLVAFSDPEMSTPAFSFLAIGDWGTTLGKERGDPGSCCQM
jgi:hypothetical protein